MVSKSSGRHLGAGKISHPKNLGVSAPSQTHQAHKIHTNPCKGPVLGTHFVFDSFPNTDAYIFTRILFFLRVLLLGIRVPSNVERIRNKTGDTEKIEGPKKGRKH